MNPTEITAFATVLSVIITAIVTGLINLITARSNVKRDKVMTEKIEKESVLSARKDEVILLHEELERAQTRLIAEERRSDERIVKLELAIEAQEKEADKMRERILHLVRQNAWLTIVLQRNGITVPPMPLNWGNGEIVQDEPMESK